MSGCMLSWISMVNEIGVSMPEGWGWCCTLLWLHSCGSCLFFGALLTFCRQFFNFCFTDQKLEFPQVICASGPLWQTCD